MEQLRLAELIPLLDAALRGRVDSAAALAEISSTPLAIVERQLIELERLGFVSIANGSISYRRPDAAASLLSEQIFTALTPQITDTIASAQATLAVIPSLLQAWDEGSNNEHRMQVDVLHGPWAPADMWRLQFSRRVPQKSDVCMPSTAALFAPQLEYQSSFWASRTDQPVDVRLLMSVADATHPAGRERIQGELDSGVQIRMHPNPPSFFWITDDDTIGIPLTWGEAWPTSVIAIQSPSLGAAFSSMYERLWNAAVPVNPHPAAEGHGDQPWDAMLRLMNQGVTMDAASYALGIAPRTGRRRVADAMSHFNATSHFSLGVAWHEAQRNRPLPA